MVFRELKQGYPLFILNRGTMEVKTGAVTQIGAPHITADKNKIAKGQFMTVVDVSANVDGKIQAIELPDNMSYTTSDDGSLLIATNKEDIVNGIKFIKAQSEDALRLVPQHKETVEKCETLLHDFDPSYKQTADYEERFSKIENSQKELGSKLDKILAAISEK